LICAAAGRRLAGLARLSALLASPEIDPSSLTALGRAVLFDRSRGPGKDHVNDYIRWRSRRLAKKEIREDCMIGTVADG
jgi:hypothetical protein